MSNVAYNILDIEKNNAEITKAELAAQRQRIQELVLHLNKEGYALCNKGIMQNSYGDPSATMVIKGNTFNSARREPNISHAMVFINTEDSQISSLDFALPGDTPSDAIDKLYTLGVSCISFPGGDPDQPDHHIVAIDFDPSELVGSGKSLEEVLLKLETFGLKTCPYPFESNALSVLPPFRADVNMAESMEAKFNVQKILSNLGAHHDVMSYTNIVQKLVDDTLSQRRGQAVEIDQSRSVSPGMRR